MEQIDLSQILILVMQCLLVATILLALFRMRQVMGIGLMFAALGVFQYMQAFLANSLYFEVIPGILISPGSSVLFSGTLFAILIIYIREDASVARTLIYALVLANMILVLLGYSLGYNIESASAYNPFNLPADLLIGNAWLLLTGTVLLFIDGILLIVFYEFISRYTHSLFLRILLTTVAVLMIDAILFPVGAFLGDDQFIPILKSGLLAKVASAMVYAPIFTLYLIYFEKDVQKAGQASFQDIYHLLTYRQRYEQVSKEKALQKIEAEKALSQEQLVAQRKHAALIKRNHLVLANMQDGFLLGDLDGNIIEVNQAYCDMTGYTRAELLRMKGWEISLYTTADNLSESIAWLKQVKKAKVETKHLKKDGGIVWLDVNISMITSEETAYIASFCRDITEQKQAEAALLESKERLARAEERYRKLYHNSPDMIVSVDPEDGKILICNDTLLKKTGFTRAEVIGQPIFNLYHEDCLEEVKLYFQEFQRHGSLRNKELVLRTSSGGKIDVALSVDAVRDESGRIIQSVSSWRDISELKQIDRWKNLTAKLEAANQELKSFSYSVSHDLRAPLRRIEGFSEALFKYCSENINEEAHHYLTRIMASAQHMSTLVDKMLILSQISNQDIQKEIIDLTQLSISIIQQLQEAEPERSAKISIQKNLQIEMDDGLARLMMMNLLNNAWKYTKVKPEARIEVGLIQKQGINWYFVKDNGMGFDMKYYDRLFTPFQRLHTEETIEGTGIGMATVKRIINRHNGRIQAEGVPGEGAVFYFQV